MIVLLFGAPGCGKGTQARYLAERFQIPAISTGDMFRAECQAGTELGKAACSILASGGLVEDDIVNAMVADRIARQDCAHGFLLDGYPRTVLQAQFLSQLIRKQGLDEPLVLHLDVPEPVLIERLASRRYCPECRAIYNLGTNPPRREGLCDRDGASLQTRDDDQAAVIRQRLRAYEEATGPVLRWYGRSAVTRINGAQDPRRVAEVIERALTPVPS